MPDPLAVYPALAGVSPGLPALGAAGQPMTVPAGTLLFSEQESCKGFPLVLDGEVRVSRSSADGRSLELYRVGPGELAAALLGHGRELAVTHQALAQELGTVREIVTRLLRRFEREGWVELSRERIRILDSAALRSHCGRAA